MRMETRLTGSLSKIMHHVQPKPCLLQGDSPFSVLLCQEYRWINGEAAFADHPLWSAKGAPVAEEENALPCLAWERPAGR